MNEYSQQQEQIKTPCMNPIYQFFCWAGGANVSVLREMPTEQNRFFGYGTVICMTAIFAMLSSGYAFSLLWPEKAGFIAFLPALAWGCFIFVLDRFFIVTISNRGGFWRKLLMASPRLILAIFIGVIISKPLEFRIFEREINDQLLELKSSESKRYDSLQRIELSANISDKERDVNYFMNDKKDFAQISTDIVQIVASVRLIDSAINARQDSVTFEDKGIGKTKLVGEGPASRYHQKIVDELKRQRDSIIARRDIAQIRKDSLTKLFQKDIDSISVKHIRISEQIEEKFKKRKLELEANYKPSILNQQIALAKIQHDKEKPSAYYTVWFITILFIFIEMAPMLLKLMTRGGSYENRIAKIEASYSTEDRLNHSLSLEEYKSNRSLVQKMARSQRDIVKTALDNWHGEQMEKMQDEPGYYNSLFTENRDNNI